MGQCDPKIVISLHPHEDCYLSLMHTHNGMRVDLNVTSSCLPCTSHMGWNIYTQELCLVLKDILGINLNLRKTLYNYVCSLKENLFQIYLQYYIFF